MEAQQRVRKKSHTKNEASNQCEHSMLARTSIEAICIRNLLSLISSIKIK